MGKTSADSDSGSASSSAKGGKGNDSLAAPLLCAGAASTDAPSTVAVAPSLPTGQTRVNTAGERGQEWSSSLRTPLQQDYNSERRNSSSSGTSTRAFSVAGHLDSSFMLLPLSLTPAIALEPQVQSIDLWANVKAYDHGQGCCSYLCSHCSPVFDWVSYLHAETLQRRVPASGASGTQDAATASPRNAGARSGESRAQQPRSQQPRSMALFVDVGQAPTGGQATLPTLFGYRQLVFRAVQEVNRAYSNFWRVMLLVLLLLVLFLPGIGLLALLLIGCCSSLRKMCDDAVLQQMRSACERADQRLAAWGVGLLLMEGYPAAPLIPIGGHDLEMGPASSAARGPFAGQARNVGPSLAGASAVYDAHAAAALAAVAAAPSPNSRVWVLRVYMLPGSHDGTSTGTAAAAATPAARTQNSLCSGPQLSSNAPVPSPARTSDSSAVTQPASSSGESGASPAASVQVAAETPSNTSRPQGALAARAQKLIETSPRCLGAAEASAQQQGQQEAFSVQLSQEDRAPGPVSAGGTTAAADTAVAPDENEHSAAAAAAVADTSGAATAETSGAAAAADDTEAVETGLGETRASPRTLSQKESDSKKKRKGRKNGTRANDIREPLLCQEDKPDGA